MVDRAQAPIVKALDGLQQALICHHGTSHSWGKTAAAYGLSKAMAHLIATTGYEPRTQPVRQALGLPPLGTIQMGPGVTVAFGAILMVSSSICPCDRSFIPNHPSRTHCPTCRPPRKRERRLT
jgi:hypothetical protein